MLRVAVVTIFPEMFAALTGHGISGRACRDGLVELRCWNPRDYATDRHRSVDDRPYGGGPGMVLMAPPLCAAIREARASLGGAAMNDIGLIELNEAFAVQAIIFMREFGLKFPDDPRMTPGVVPSPSAIRWRRPAHVS